MLAVVNHVDKLYRSLGIRVMLVGLEIWTYGDQIEVSPDPDATLERFRNWRQQTLLPRTKHDNAQFITKVDFIGNTVGLAYTGVLCTSNSVAVNEDHNDNAIGVATTLAHEMGHNLGLSHDAPGCVCRSSQPQSGCIKAPSHG
ncbi:disintegrin and metalloproteinase domain-containing protein 8-like [Gadus macrocephalus]|uniref:disintegrin and metalloproteinase domain-containing protein 8-like n=2 Tax=Gadus macrocephalus TaxID=80720 RepID=UPI0028CBB10F|nr:disintegrin and metalloproteinase domain-containing protein 8-like [Gadus macrocephalus]